MRSPRSVSTTSMPRASRCGFRPHSSVSIDLLFTTRRAPRAASSSRHDPAQRRRVGRPVHVRARGARTRLEADEQLVEVVERVGLERGGALAQRLPVGHLGGRGVAAPAQVPDRGVVLRELAARGQVGARASIEGSRVTRRRSVREDLRQVDRARAEALAAPDAVEVQQAASVGAGDVVRARVGEGAQAREAHAPRERRDA